MRLKYYLRGAGIGMIAAALILMIAYHVAHPAERKTPEVSTETTDPAMAELFEASEAEPETEAVTTEAAAPAESEDTDGTTISTEDGRTVITEHERIDDTPVAEDTEAEEPPEPIASEAELPQTPVIIHISRGDGPSAVADKLYAAGLIPDTASFVDHLVRNGLNDYLEVGDFSIDPGSGYEEIGRILTTNPETVQ